MPRRRVLPVLLTTSSAAKSRTRDARGLAVGRQRNPPPGLPEPRPSPARPCPPALTGLPTTRLCLGFQNSRLEMTGCRAAHAQSHRTDGARARFAGGPTTRPARTCATGTNHASQAVATRTCAVSRWLEGRPVRGTPTRADGEGGGHNVLSVGECTTPDTLCVVLPAGPGRRGAARRGEARFLRKLLLP